MLLKVGHRGARAYETENTIESFAKAIAMGANAVELDVRLTKDGKLAVSHDDNLKRVFGTDVFVGEATLKTLKELTDGKLPELAEALDFIDGKVEKILVELKEAGTEEKVLNIIKRKKLKDRVIVVSFLEEALKNIRQLDKDIETGLIYAKHKGPLKAALELNAQYLVALYRFLHRSNVEAAHKNGLKVIVWTINTLEEAREYKAKGVDGIASDRPDILKEL